MSSILNSLLLKHTKRPELQNMRNEKKGFYSSRPSERTRQSILPKLDVLDTASILKQSPKSTNLSQLENKFQKNRFLGHKKSQKKERLNSFEYNQNIFRATKSLLKHVQNDRSNTKISKKLKNSFSKNGELGKSQNLKMKLSSLNLHKQTPLNNRSHDIITLDIPISQNSEFDKNGPFSKSMKKSKRKLGALIKHREVLEEKQSLEDKYRSQDKISEKNYMVQTSSRKVQIVSKRVQKFTKPKKRVEIEKLKIGENEIIEVVASCHSPLQRFMLARRMMFGSPNNILKDLEEKKNLEKIKKKIWKKSIDIIEDECKEHTDSLKDLNIGTKIALKDTVQSYRRETKSRFSKRKKPKKPKTEKMFLGDVTGWEQHERDANCTPDTKFDQQDLLDEFFGP